MCHFFRQTPRYYPSFSIKIRSTLYPKPPLPWYRLNTTVENQKLVSKFPMLRKWQPNTAKLGCHPFLVLLISATVRTLVMGLSRHYSPKLRSDQDSITLNRDSLVTAQLTRDKINAYVGCLFTWIMSIQPNL